MIRPAKIKRTLTLISLAEHIMKLFFDRKRILKVLRLRQSFNGHNLGNDPPTNPVKINNVFLFLLLKSQTTNFEKIFNPRIIPSKIEKTLEYILIKSLMLKLNKILIEFWTTKRNSL